LRSFAPDDDAGTRCADADAELVRHTVDLNAGDACRLKAALQLPLQLQVLMQPGAVVALGEPARLPRLVVSQPEPIWMDFLSHSSSPSRLSQRGAKQFAASWPPNSLVNLPFRRRAPQCDLFAADTGTRGPWERA